MLPGEAATKGRPTTSVLPPPVGNTTTPSDVLLATSCTARACAVDLNFPWSRVAR